MFASWTSPDGVSEFAVSFDSGRTPRVLFVPALFDEANKMRRLMIEVMRKIDTAGIDSFLPDLPGCHESPSQLCDQDLSHWREAIDAASTQFSATHVFAVRGGCGLAPAKLEGWHYAPVTGARVLRGLLRSRVIADREAGHHTTSEVLLSTGLEQGLNLAGYELGQSMIAQLSDHKELGPSRQVEISPDEIGGAGLWLAAEPGENPEQVRALATAIITGSHR